MICFDHSKYPVLVYVEVIVWVDCKLAIGQVVSCQVTIFVARPPPKLLTSSKVTRTYLYFCQQYLNAKNIVCRSSYLNPIQHKLLSCTLNLVNCLLRFRILWQEKILI